MELTERERLAYLRGYLLGLAGRLEELALNVDVMPTIEERIRRAAADCRQAAEMGQWKDNPQ